MPGNLNGTSFWTAIFGLIAALLTLVATVGGLLATFQGGTSAGGNSEEPSPAPAASATPIVITATPTPIRAPTATPTPVPSPTVEVESEGRLEIPVSSEDSGEGADLDSGDLVRSNASEAEAQSDIFVTENEDGIVIEPGVRRTDEDDFEARFLLVAAPGGDQDTCLSPTGPSTPDQQLLLFSDIDVGDHVCMVTTEGRLAEFEIKDVKLTGHQRWLEIRYTTWAGQ